MDKIQYGVYQAINNCLKVKSSEQVCIITDERTKGIGHLLRDEVLKITSKVKVFVMEDFGSRPKDGSNPLKFPIEIAGCLKKSQVSIYTAGREKGELESFRAPMLNLIDELKTIRHAHMVDVNETIMAMGMNADYRKIQEFNAKLIGLLAGATSVKVTAPAGTNLDVELNSHWRWLNDDGNIKPEKWHNLPAGEVYTCATGAEGRIVADGVLGDYMSKKYGIIKDTPLSLVVKNGRIAEVSCKNKDIEKDVIEYSKQDNNANRIGEFGIGTNIGLERLVGVLLQDEKFPGAHFALGHGYPNKTGADWDSKAHLDMVITGATIEIDGKLIMKNGRFVF